MSYYTSLGGGRMRDAATATAGLSAATKAEQVEQLAVALQRCIRVHEQEFLPASGPKTAAAVRPSLQTLYEKHARNSLIGLSRFKLKARREAREAAKTAASTEADRLYDEARTLQTARQAELDLWWSSICRNDPDLLIAHLSAAFEDNDAPAAPLSVMEDGASVVVLLPDVTVLPDRLPSVTASGNPSMRRMTKAESADLYKLLACSITLVTVKETFAVAPGLRALTVVGVRPTPRDAYGHRRTECLIAARFRRERLDGVRWAETDSVTIMNGITDHLLVEQRGASRVWAAIDLNVEPDLAKIVAAVDLESLSRD